jgi:hypothetical protein
MKKVNMDIAERCELDLRRRLRSAERFSEAAILRGLDFVNTRFSSVSASLSRVTRADQRLPLRLALFDLVRCLAIAPANVRQLGCVPSLAWAQLRTKVRSELTWKAL